MSRHSPGINYGNLTRMALIQLIRQHPESALQEILYSVLRRYAQRSGTSIGFLLTADSKMLYADIENAEDELKTMNNE